MMSDIKVASSTRNCSKLGFLNPKPMVQDQPDKAGTAFPENKAPPWTCQGFRYLGLGLRVSEFGSLRVFRVWG